MDKQQIFISKLTSLRKLKYSDEVGEQIDNQIASCVEYLCKNLPIQEQFENFNLLFDEVFSTEILTKGFISNSTFDLLFSHLSSCCDLSNFDLIAIAISKIVSQKIKFDNVVVISDILHLVYDSLEPCNRDLIQLKFEMEKSSNTMIELASKIEHFIDAATAYDLYRNADARISVARFLYSQYERTADHTFKIFFPFCGTGIECVLIAYLMSLIDECKTGHCLESCLFFVSQNDEELLGYIKGQNGIYDELLIGLKKSFCEQNNVKFKNIKTSIKSLRKKIIIKKTTEQVNADFTFYIPQNENMSLQNYPNLITSCSEDSLKNLQKNGFIVMGQIFAHFDSKLEKPISYIFGQFAEKNKEESKKDDFEQLYSKRKSIDSKHLKRLLITSDFLIDEQQMLRYAHLLALANQYSKSFDIIKQHYKKNCDFAYEILQIIQQSCKNEKLNGAIERFIVDAALDKDGFGEAMLEAVVDGLDDYFEKNPDSELKDSYWL